MVKNSQIGKDVLVAIFQKCFASVRVFTIHKNMTPKVTGLKVIIKF